VRPVGACPGGAYRCAHHRGTNRDLSQMVETGTFREDLFYRLNVITVQIPPLRERSDDLPALIDHSFRLFALVTDATESHRARGSSDALAYEWPGNVRQLEHVLLNAWLMSDATRSRRSTCNSRPDADWPADTESYGGCDETRGRRAIARGVQGRGESGTSCERLNGLQWNRVQAAKQLGLPRRTFYRRLKEYGIL